MVSRLNRTPVQIGSLLLLRKLLANGVLHDRDIHVQDLRNYAHIDHVANKLAQLRLRTYRGRQLINRHRIEGHIVAILIELQ